MANLNPVRVALVAQSAEAGATLQHADAILADFGLARVTFTLSDEKQLHPFIVEAEAKGVLVYIVANASKPPLAGLISRVTSRPVLAVPVITGELDAMAALQNAMEVNVGTLAIGKAGAINAALLAVAILANTNFDLRQKLESFRANQTAKVLADRLI